MTAPRADARLRMVLALATLFGVAAMLVWSTWLGIHAVGGMVVHTPYSAPPHLWHAHEMVFGYGGALLAGCLVATAGARVGRSVVALAAAVWLAGRGAMWFSASLDPVLVAAIDLAFLPLLALCLLGPSASASILRTLMAFGLAGMVWAGNLVVHLDWLGHGGPGTGAGLRAAVLALCAALAVLSMRAGPAGQDVVPQRGRLRLPDVVLTGGVLVVPLLVLVGMPDALLGRVAMLTGGGCLLWLMIAREPEARYRPFPRGARLTLALLGVGLLVWGLALHGVGSEIAGLHVLAVGALGGGALAAMSALVGGASEGHAMTREITGWAGGLMLLSVLLRWGGSSLGIDLYFPLMLASGAAWALAMTVALVALWPPSTNARATAARAPRIAAPCGKVAPRMRHYWTT